MNNERSIVFGDEVCRFETFQSWVNKSASWTGPEQQIVFVDALGRICQIGKHFMNARDDGAFPVVVYRAEPDSK